MKIIIDLEFAYYEPNNIEYLNKQAELLFNHEEIIIEKGIHYSLLNEDRGDTYIFKIDFIDICYNNGELTKTIFLNEIQ